MKACEPFLNIQSILDIEFQTAIWREQNLNYLTYSSTNLKTAYSQLDFNTIIIIIKYAALNML